MRACPEELDYLNKSKRHKFPDMDDVKEFGDFVDAMQTLGFDQDEQKMMVQIACAYLHIGNVKVSAKGEVCQAGAGNKSFEVDSREDSYDARVGQVGKAPIMLEIWCDYEKFWGRLLPNCSTKQDVLDEGLSNRMIVTVSESHCSSEMKSSCL